jgi:hypothetical protein
MRTILQLRQDAEADMAASTRSVWPSEADFFLDMARRKFAAAEELCMWALQKANPESFFFYEEFPLDKKHALQAQRDAVRSARTQLDLVEATLRRAREEQELPLDQRNALRAQRDAEAAITTQLELLDATLRRARD